MLDELRDIALDLTWTWNHRIRAFFEALDPEGWETTGHNPVALLAGLGEEGVERALRRPHVREALERARAALRAYRERQPTHPDVGAPLVIGYFSLEFGLTEALPIY